MKIRKNGASFDTRPSAATQDDLILTPPRPLAMPPRRRLNQLLETSVKCRSSQFSQGFGCKALGSAMRASVLAIMAVRRSMSFSALRMAAFKSLVCSLLGLGAAFRGRLYLRGFAEQEGAIILQITLIRLHIALFHQPKRICAGRHQSGS